MVGRIPGPNANNNDLDWQPFSFTIIDATHLTSANGTLTKIGRLDDPKFRNGAPNVELVPYEIRREPFDLNGTWQNTLGRGPLYSVRIVQKNGELTIINPVGKEFFRAPYATNPKIMGKGIPASAPINKPFWVDEWLEVKNPDNFNFHNPSGVFEWYRISNPPAHDIPCDEQNSFHLERAMAWVRGRVANSVHDFKSARCWLTVAANANFAPAQSLLAALLLQQANVADADYTLSFQMASKSAQQNDIAGQLLLASLYRDGKGTLKDPQKAQFWTQRAQQSKMAAQWKMLNSDVFMGLSPLKIAGLAVAAANASSGGSDAHSSVVCPGDPNNHSGLCH